MKVTYRSKKFGDDIHLIFFHGIGDNHKHAQQYAQYLCTNLQRSTSNMLRITGHAHKYPPAFQNYIAYSIASFLFLGASILAPIIMILCSPSVMMIGLASLAALTCIFLSILLIVIPFIHRDQNLFKSSIEKIEQLIDDGVKPENIILFGHSFGGAAASEVLKYFANNDVKLGGIFFTSAFSSFEEAIKYFPIPQTKILNMLPPSFLKKLLKALDLDFDIVRDIKELQDEEKLNVPIVMINNEGDYLIPQPAQLKYAVENSTLLHEELIKTFSTRGLEDDPHNGVLFGWKVTEELTDLILNRVNKAHNTTISSSYS